MQSSWTTSGKATTKLLGESECGSAAGGRQTFPTPGGQANQNCMLCSSLQAGARAKLTKENEVDLISWVFCGVYDAFHFGYLSETIGVRYIQGSAQGKAGKGLPEELMWKRELLNYLLTKYLPSKSLPSHEYEAIKTACSSYHMHRKMCGSMYGSLHSIPFDSFIDCASLCFSLDALV